MMKKTTMTIGEQFAVDLFKYFKIPMALHFCKHRALYFSAQKFGFKSASEGGKTMHFVYSFQW
jgi:hypothetical protein